MYMQTTDFDKKKTKLSNLLNKISDKSNTCISKKNLQQSCNNITNTYAAVNKISQNKGAGTAGIDGKTINGLTTQKINKLHHKYVNNQYRQKPVKKVLIPKKGSNKKRPLGIPTINDRILQQAILQLITPFYEHKFSEWSFGFRNKLSCLDAIKRAKERFQGIDFLIKIDIEGYFDTINHPILLEQLVKHIKKHKVIKTINKWLTAGLVEFDKTVKTISGTPQGGIISPLLANIYLNYIDWKLNDLIVKGTPKRIANPEYGKLYRRNKPTIGVDREINLNPATRIEYIRYADDFIIGIKGNYNDAEKTMETVTNWITNDLQLTVSKDKSKIVKANKGTKFLSYMIKINPTASKVKKKTTKTTLNGSVQILIPKDEIQSRTISNGWVNRKEKIVHDKKLIYRKPLEILRTYLTVTRGIIQYFSKGLNLAQLTKLAYTAEYSCLKTIAGKFKTSIAKVRKKFSLGKTWGIKYNLKGKPKYETWKKWNWENIKTTRPKDKTKIDVEPNKFFLCGRTYVTDRLMANQCEICKQTEGTMEIHHTKTVRDANLQSIMNKATKVLCRKCHRKITNQQLATFAWQRKQTKQISKSKTK